ncbi:MAG: hypothetical protein WAU17_13000 [Nitrospirales bacterium]
MLKDEESLTKFKNFIALEWGEIGLTLFPQRPSALSCRPHPHLFENNTWIWLNGLTRKAKRIIRLEDVPDQKWDALQDGGRLHVVDGIVEELS